MDLEAQAAMMSIVRERHITLKIHSTNNYIHGSCGHPSSGSQEPLLI